VADPTTDQLGDAYRVAQAQAATVAAAQTLLAFRHLLDPLRLDKTFPVYAGVAGRILNQSRQVTSALGRAFYIAHRRASGVLGDAPEIARAGALAPAQVTTSLLFTGPITIREALGRGATLPEAVAAAQKRTSGAAYRHAADGGRQTIVAAAASDPEALGWARVTDGDPCFFCAMLSSRGPVYLSQESATLAQDSTRYHDHCGCYAAPVYTHDAPWPGNGREYQKLWAEATRGKHGQAAINAFRQALADRKISAPTPEPIPVPEPDPHAEAFARWRVGRGVKLAKLDVHGRMDREWAERDLAENARQLAEVRKIIADRRDELKNVYGLKGAEIRSAMSREVVMKRAKESEAHHKQRDAELKQRIADLPADNLPPLDPANPLAAYGDKLVMHDESPQVFQHMSELERFYPVGAHRTLRDHFAEKPGAGFFLGDNAVPELDDLGHLRGVQPRGWSPGETWDSVDGAYSPGTRVCACGGKVNGAGAKHSSTALHEGGHAFDDALATQGVIRGGASRSDEFRAMWDSVLTAHGSRLKVEGYFTPEANPTGYYSEAFAEAWAEWSRARVLQAGDKAAMAEVIGRALTRRLTIRQDGDVYAKHAIAAGRKVIAYFDRMARTLKLDK
jgi:hypothetical protein